MPRTNETIVDIHAHPTLKYIYREGSYLWNSRYQVSPLPDLIGVYPFSSCDFRRMAIGGVQVVFVGLHPIEQPAFFPRKLRFWSLKRIIASYVASIRRHRLDTLSTREYDHWDHIIAELNKIKHTEQDGILNPEVLRRGFDGPTRCRLEIVNSYARVREIIAENEANNEEFKIAVVITIEGGHALGCGHVVQKTNSNRNDSNTPANVDEAKLLERVNALKGVGSAGTPAWEPTPLWITLAHAFGNNIIGNAQALPKFYKPKLRFFEPHWKGTESGDTIPEYELTLNKGMTPTGEKIIKRLLGIDGNNQGRRILIDIKHMSIRSRLKYYEILDVNKAQYPDDNIPIILSHGGVNGEPSITTAGKDPTDSHEDWLRRDRREKFNPWSFGLHDDEIIRIHRSQGLIGLIVDQRVLACRKRVPPIRSKLWSSRKWARLVTDQILHIVKTVYAEGLSDKADIWNMICIGTDFDGGINPMDKYKTATRFKELFENVESLLGESKFESYRDGVDAHALTVNIFSKNALDFLKKHY